MGHSRAVLRPLYPRHGFPSGNNLFRITRRLDFRRRARILAYGMGSSPSSPSSPPTSNASHRAYIARVTVPPIEMVYVIISLNHTTTISLYTLSSGR